MFVTTKHIIMNKVISHIYYEQINTRAFPYWPGYHPETIYYILPTSRKETPILAWMQYFYNTSLFQFITILSTSRQTLAMKLSLQLICFIIRLYLCNINRHLLNQWFLFCLLLINVTVLWSVNTTNGWNVHHNCFKNKNKASFFFQLWIIFSDLCQCFKNK
jgi:hypothetical protein